MNAPRGFRRELGVSHCHHCNRQLMFKPGGGAFSFALVITPDDREVRVHHQCVKQIVGDGYKEKK